MPKFESAMKNPTRLRDLNGQLHSQIVGELPRPKQLTEQSRFDAWFLSQLNQLALEFSKGRRAFQVTDENEALLSAIFAYLNRNEDDSKLVYMGEPLDLHKGLFIAGLFGVGKTLILKSIFLNRGKLGLRGRYATAQQVFNASRPKADPNLQDLIGPNYCDLWLDDIGEEPAMAKDYGTDSTPVGDLIKSKATDWEQMKEAPRLFGTSNLISEKQITDVYGGRIYSRINGICNFIISQQETDYRQI